MSPGELSMVRCQAYLAESHGDGTGAGGISSIVSLAMPD